MPNPFDRPRALLMVEVTGTEGSCLILVAYELLPNCFSVR